MSDFNEIYTKKWKLVYKTCYDLLYNHALAEEAMQETFYKLMVNFEKVEQKTINAWLKKVAENTCIDILRKMQTEKKVVAELSVEADNLGIELMKEAKEIANTLAPKYREVFHLAFECGLHNREIADLIKKPLTTVESRLKVCLNKILRELV